MTSKQDKVIRLIGDFLVAALSVSVALAAIHPDWAWLAVVIAIGKGIQKFTVEVEAPPAKPPSDITMTTKLPLVLLAFVALGAGNTSCGHVPGGAPGVVSCAADAVQHCAPTALPAVNDCLSGDGDVVTCLVGLIQPVGCLTEQTIACVVRHEGSSASAAAQANPGDSVDQKRATRAKEYLARTGVRFAD